MVFAFLVMSVGHAQDKIEIVDIVEENKITNFNKQPLILIDFWATWCAPCVPATQQLEVYQGQIPDDVFMMGFSSESRSTIESFLTRNPIDIAVVQDVKKTNETFFNVTYRPYTVILNARGKLVWKGRPGDLSTSFLKRLARKQPKMDYDLLDVFSLQEQEESNYELTAKDTAQVYIKHLKESGYNEFSKTSTRVNYRGNLEEIIAKIIGEPTASVSSAKEVYLDFSCSIDYWEKDKQVVLDKLKEYFKFQIKNHEVSAQVKELKVTMPDRLWSANQILWNDKEQAQSLISDDRIKADNFTIKDIALLLSNLKNQYFEYNTDDTEVYDWDFHYLFENLMLDELENEFGVKVINHKEKSIFHYTIEYPNNRGVNP